MVMTWQAKNKNLYFSCTHKEDKINNTYIEILQQDISSSYIKKYTVFFYPISKVPITHKLQKIYNNWYTNEYDTEEQAMSNVDIFLSKISKLKSFL